MEDNLHSCLAKVHRPKHDLAVRTNLSLKEKQTIYKLQFGRPRTCSSFHVDGDIITTGNKCDYILLAKQEENGNNWIAVFVELKGTDVEHAVLQLDATMSNKVFSHVCVKERHARIVAKSFPANKSNPKYEKAKRLFKKKHGCSLIQVSSGHPDTTI